jgi:chromosome segregation protein
LVHIEKLVCKGFKSFGRETVTIKFSEGFTCIVGPNGSGKSNVIDAVLFVLGQLSAKTLRANVFSDLLYSPPKPDMPPKANKASVELYFNNKDRKLQIEADRVVIERELDESGTSTCRINGKTVTRSTVLDILGGIGVDPNGYNLVLQGEIAQMVKVSPIDRRKLIEEIAGISAYDEQKERAMKKLAESESNLSRVETQLQERRRQLEKLEYERTDALRHQNLRNQIQDIRIDNLAWTIVKSNTRIGTINETLAERAEEAEKLNRELSEVEEKIETTESEIDEIDSQIDQITGGDSARVSEQYGVISAAVDHLRDDLERAEEAFNAKRTDRQSLKEQLETVGQEMETSQNQVKSKRRELEALDVEIDRTTDQIAALEESLAREQESYYETQQKLQDLNNQMMSLDEAVSEVRSAIKSDERELGLAYEERRDATEGLERTKKELEELEQIVPAKGQTLEESEREEEKKERELARVNERLETIDAEVSEAAKVLNSTREELIKFQARQDALKEAEEAFLKRKRAVARVLELRDMGIIEGIHGTVAELGTIDPDYAIAMEIAGGSRLTYVVVEDEHVATECVNILKRERIGRASFIPLDKIRTRSPGRTPDEAGVIGYAIDLVSFDQKFQAAFEFTFSDTIVTEDFESAKQLGFKGKRAVTLDGDLVERSGLITGGHYTRGGSGLTLQLEDRSPEIIEKLQGLEKIHGDLRNKQDELREDKKELSLQIQELSKSNYRARIELDRDEENLQEKIARKKALEEIVQKSEITIEAFEQQIAELRERDQELSAHREHVRKQRDHCNEILAKSDASKITQDMKDLKEVLEHMRKKRERLQSDVTGLEVAIDERLEPKTVELEMRLQALAAVIPELEEETENLRTRLSDKEEEMLDLRSERERIEDSVKDKRVRQVRLKEDLRNLRLRHEEIREEQTNNEKAVYRLQTEQSRLEEDLVALRAELANLSEVDSELEERKEEEELTYREIEELEEKIHELERELEAMGAVNLKSLTDYDIEKEKYEEIVDKKTRLEEEHKEILEFMEELEREKTRKFLQVYNEIADNFAKVFARLSPGGEANLMLENPEHPLMGGITVRSKPRGKDLVSLEAMSGGEKTLTGLALIFAVQMYSPASFYVFDEIDAALDDVNAHNVALLISDMAKESQFIVVSLRDVTVRKADLLVGVSNQDGISRIVAVDLEEVAEAT